MTKKLVKFPNFHIKGFTKNQEKKKQKKYLNFTLFVNFAFGLFFYITQAQLRVTKPSIIYKRQILGIVTYAVNKAISTEKNWKTLFLTDL